MVWETRGGQLRDFERIWEQVSIKMDLNPTAVEGVEWSGVEWSGVAGTR